MKRVLWAFVLLTSCSKPGPSPTKPPAPVFYASLAYPDSTVSFAGLTIFCIDQTHSAGFFTLEGVNTFSQNADTINDSRAITFHIFTGALTTGTFNMEAAGFQANSGFYQTGWGVFYSFQPIPGQDPVVAQGSITIASLDSGRVSGTFACFGENTNLDASDFIVVHGAFSEVPVVVR